MLGTHRGRTAPIQADEEWDAPRVAMHDDRAAGDYSPAAHNRTEEGQPRVYTLGAALQMQRGGRTVSRGRGRGGGEDDWDEDEEIRRGSS